MCLTRNVQVRQQEQRLAVMDVRRRAGVDVLAQVLISDRVWSGNWRKRDRKRNIRWSRSGRYGSGTRRV